MMETEPVLKVRYLSKSFTQGGHVRKVLDNVDFEILSGEFLTILGKSGSGKSTLLNLLSGIDKPDDPQKAEIVIGSTDITTLSETRQTIFRRDHIGIVFQFFNLIPTLTVLENITLPMELQGRKRRINNKVGQTVLEQVGLGERTRDFPDQLSGGEQQRVAIARAILHEPSLILADEPTGNLDEETGQSVLKLLIDLTCKAGKTLVMATHNLEIVPFADRVVSIQDGKLRVAQDNSR
jgi:putative ABC transport system ATP-binding protein